MNETPPSVVERLLAERIGLDPSSVGDQLIARGVHARMSALALRSKSEYDQILIDQPAELQALVEEVVVAESWFFRDERPFEALARFSQPWIADPARPPLTILSVPCASGEEPYSIAITLLEAGLSADQFRVDAVDVSGRSISRAIAGVYGPNAFRGAASDRRSSYFREQNGAFTLDLAVRSTVRFHLGNLLDATLFADRASFDIVFCRNLLIYLDDDAKALAFASLTRLIVDGGLLFLGHADRLEALESSLFEPIAEKGCFTYRKSVLPPSPLLREVRKAPEKERGTGRVQPEPLVGRPLGEAQRGLAPERIGGAWPPCSVSTGRVQPEPVPISRAVRQENSPASSLLDRASILADLGRYDEATALVEQAISGGGANARAYFLLGMMAQASGTRQQAEAHYLKAIYLDPQHDEALLALALLARRKGDVAAEAGYRRRAERVLARKVVP
jgi:chemotaxis protein methyltransferase WspC